MTDTPMQPVLINRDEDGIATLTLNRPERYNAFNSEMIDEWHRLLQALKHDDGVKVIVLTGAGKAFCSGGDVGSQSDRLKDDNITRKNYLYRNVHRIARAMESMDKPTIAAINGPARGAGLDMALMCDLRLMAHSASVAESYINVGLIAGDGGAYYLPRLIGMPRALELFWTGREVKSDEAERIGLVNRAVPDDELLPATYELARTIARQPAEAVRLFKRIAYQSADMSLDAHLDMVSSHMAVLRDTPEHRERVAAFLARKRER